MRKVPKRFATQFVQALLSSSRGIQPFSLCTRTTARSASKSPSAHVKCAYFGRTHAHCFPSRSPPPAQRTRSRVVVSPLLSFRTHNYPIQRHKGAGLAQLTPPRRSKHWHYRNQRGTLYRFRTEGLSSESEDSACAMLPRERWRPLGRAVAGAARALAIGNTFRASEGPALSCLSSCGKKFLQKKCPRVV